MRGFHLFVRNSQKDSMALQAAEGGASQEPNDVTHVLLEIGAELTGLSGGTIAHNQ